MTAKAFGALPLVAAAAFGIFALAPSTAKANTLCPSQATVGGFNNTSSTVAGPLDGSCGANSAVKIDIAHSNDYGKLQFGSGMPGFPAGLTLGGLAGASANVAFTSGGGDQPFFLLPFVDSTQSLGQANATDQILLIEFQSAALSGNTLALDPNATLFNLFDNTNNGPYLQGGQSDAKTLDAWLAIFPQLAGDQLQGIWIGEGMAGSDTGPDSLTVNSLDVTSATPLPAALPMFGSALGLAGGYFGWRRKKKAAA